MILNWNGLRASAGAAALALTLLAGAPAQAAMYKITMTEHDADGSTNVGSGIIDTANSYIYSGNGYFNAYYNMTDFSGIFKPIYQNFGGQFYVENYGSNRAGIYNSSYQTVGGIDFYQDNNMSGEISAESLFTPGAIANGQYDVFQLGQYDLGNSGGYFNMSTYNYNDGSYTGTPSNFNPVSMTLRIGPAAPAPLVGGGLLSALAALLALGMTRFARRGNVLA